MTRLHDPLPADEPRCGNPSCPDCYDRAGNVRTHATDACPSCGGDAGDNWFDRSICPCDDTMHTRCVKCGHALDGCKFEHATGTRAACACGETTADECECGETWKRLAWKRGRK